ncbi:hypothetical protein BJX66DRAFT_301714 [Aspergillus keveii]|uniref:Uncharacterized protein n=1 Tax=Aspergillus keveii TaxID=714993 RepID=A0ABR4GA64_9EURO
MDSGGYEWCVLLIDCVNICLVLAKKSRSQSGRSIPGILRIPVQCRAILLTDVEFVKPREKNILQSAICPC